MVQSKNNHIIINMDDYSIIDTKINDNEKNKEKTLIVDYIEISEENISENNFKENQFGLKEHDSDMKLKRPILIW